MAVRTEPGQDRTGTTDRTRRFRPAFIAAVPTGWMAVDELQPVAMVVGPAGDVLDAVSWQDLPAPRDAVWPRREVVADGRSVWVHDLPDGPTVKIGTTSSGRWGAVPAVLPPAAAGLSRSRSRFSTSRTVTTGDGIRWRAQTGLVDVDWAAEVRRDAAGQHRTWPLGAGSVVDAAAAGRSAAVCVRRAPKRPWAFRPPHDLVLLGEAEAATTVVPDGLDVAGLCWPAPGPADVARGLIDYLPFTVAECRALVEAGATEVGFAVQDVDGLPTIATSFRWGPERTRFVHVDEPLDELGRSGGFRLHGITLDEDLRGSDLYRRSHDGSPVRL